MKQMSSEKLHLQWKGILLVYLLIATLISTGISFAKYTTSVDASGHARVAAFNVTTTLADAEKVLDTTKGAAYYRYMFQVRNDSEVAVKYDVVLTGVPEGVSVKWGSKSPVVSGTTHTFSNAGTLAAGNTWAYITLNFTVEKGTIIEEAEINVTVNAEQID